MALLPQAIRTIGRTVDYVTPGSATNRVTKFGRNLQSAYDYSAAHGGGNQSYDPNASIKPLNGGGGHVLSDTDTRSGAYAEDGGGGAERASTLYGIETGLQAANDALSRLGNQEQVGTGNIDREFQDAYGRLIGKKRLSDADFNQDMTTQLNEYGAARNQSGDRARGFLEGARRTLGSQGAGGGSAARFALPFEAQQMAAQGNAEAQATNNKNVIALTQDKQREDDELSNAIGDVERQRDQGRNDFKSNIESKRAELLNTIGQLTGQRTIANGGDFRAAAAAAAPYTSRISAILDSIDALAATPAVRERQVTLTRPDLAGYDFAAPEAPVVPTQDPTLYNNPVISALFGNDDRRRLALA